MQKNAKNAAFFYKECKSTQKMPCSFIKNAKERKERRNAKEHKNVAFFWKECMPNPEKNPPVFPWGRVNIDKRTI